MTNSTAGDRRQARDAHLRWIAIRELRVNPRAQREFRSQQAAAIAADLDLEALGYPVVNRRDGHYYIVDGQHRVAALKLIGYGDQQIQCDCLEGLTEAEEAELFLRRDARRAVSTFDRFRIGLTAERVRERDIERIVLGTGLCVSRSKTVANGISCVGTLIKVYDQLGGQVLGRALRIIRDAYGEPGLEAPLIHGLGLVCHRYNGMLQDDVAVLKLSDLHGGAGGLTGKAHKIRERTGNSVPQCVAAAAVEVINRGAKPKLTNWFSGEDGAS